MFLTCEASQPVIFRFCIAALSVTDGYPVGLARTLVYRKVKTYHGSPTTSWDRT